jgi:hypothetical protein
MVDLLVKSASTVPGTHPRARITFGGAEAVILSRGELFTVTIARTGVQRARRRRDRH